MVGLHREGSSKRKGIRMKEGCDEGRLCGRKGGERPGRSPEVTLDIWEWAGLRLYSPVSGEWVTET